MQVTFPGQAIVNVSASDGDSMSIHTMTVEELFEDNVDDESDTGYYDMPVQICQDILAGKTYDDGDRNLVVLYGVGDTAEFARQWDAFKAAHPEVLA